MITHSAWVVQKREDRDTHKYLRVINNATYKGMQLDWTDSAAGALQFCHEHGAVEFAKLHIAEIGIYLPLVVQHSWGSGESSGDKQT